MLSITVPGVPNGAVLKHDRMDRGISETIISRRMVPTASLGKGDSDDFHCRPLRGSMASSNDSSCVKPRGFSHSSLMKSNVNPCLPHWLQVPINGPPFGDVLCSACCRFGVLTVGGASFTSASTMPRASASTMACVLMVIILVSQGFHQGMGQPVVYPDQGQLAEGNDPR